MIQSAQNKISLYFPYLQDKNLETFVKNSPAKVKQIIIDKKSAENNAQTIENLQSS
jgi:D-tyrosyl-tRNA(Tyr) deacylase